MDVLDFGISTDSIYYIIHIVELISLFRSSLPQYTRLAHSVLLRFPYMYLGLPGNKLLGRGYCWKIGSRYVDHVILIEVDYWRR